jgi:DNA-binding NarL/FixJ family response regulator
MGGVMNKISQGAYGHDLGDKDASRFELKEVAIIDEMSSSVDEPNVLVLDARVLDRECFCGFLRSHEQKFQVTAFGSRQEWLAGGGASRPVSVVILSIGGLKLSEPQIASSIQQAASDFAPVPVVILGDGEELKHILRALECGARGYIPSSVGLAVCIEAIKLAIAGGIFIPANPVMAMSKVIEGSDTSQHFAGMFTPRQADVVMALRRGKANKIIAYELNMRESTVKVHIRNIMRKLRATNRTEVAYKINDLLVPETLAHN